MKLMNWMVLFLLFSGCGDELQKRGSGPIQIDGSSTDSGPDGTTTGEPTTIGADGGITNNSDSGTPTNTDAGGLEDSTSNVDATCTPTTSCAAEGQTCGDLSDGCATRNCGVCATGVECVEGQCVRPYLAGASCDSDAGCGGLHCIKPDQWFGGFCTEYCDVDSDCGAGAGCNPDRGFCTPICATDTDCGREGYGCVMKDNGNSYCDPIPIGNASLGEPCEFTQDCGTAGAYCTGDEFCTKECSADPQCDSNSHCAIGFCLANSCNFAGFIDLDLDGDGRMECVSVAGSGQGAGAVGDPCTSGQACGGGDYAYCGSWQDGYCSIYCGANQGVCPSGSYCNGTSSASACLATCTSQSDCRPGYTCENGTDGHSICVDPN